MNYIKLQTDFFVKTKENKITKEKYFDMLEVVPPVRYIKNAFLVGEPYDHNEDMSHVVAPRYQLYFIHDSEYYDGGLASVSDFDAFTISETWRGERRAIFIELLRELAKKTRYNVYITKDARHTFGYVINQEGKIAYTQLHDFYDCLEFAAVHKPSKEVGTGYRVETLAEAFLVAPDWASPLDIKHIKKYTKIS